MRTAALIAVLWVSLGVMAAPVSGEVIHGFADLQSGGFDFSEQTIIVWPLLLDLLAKVDLTTATVDPPGARMFCACCWNSSLMIAVPNSALEDLTEAPEDLGAYGCDGEVILDRTYVIATSDGVYAKFALRSYTPETIEYYVQTDGTRNLVEPVAVDATTWGGIKALYRQEGGTMRAPGLQTQRSCNARLTYGQSP